MSTPNAYTCNGAKGRGSWCTSFTIVLGKKKKKSKESGLSGHTLVGSILKRDFSCGRALGRLLPFNVTRLTPRSHWPFKKGSHNSHLSFEEKTSPRLKSCSFFPFHFVNYLCKPSGNPEAAPKQLDGVRWEGVYKQCAPLETCPCLPSWSTKISPSSLAHLMVPPLRQALEEV